MRSTPRKWNNEPLPCESLLALQRGLLYPRRPAGMPLGWQQQGLFCQQGAWAPAVPEPEPRAPQPGLRPFLGGSSAPGGRDQEAMCLVTCHVASKGLPPARQPASSVGKAMPRPGQREAAHSKPALTSRRLYHLLPLILLWGRWGERGEEREAGHEEERESKRKRKIH